VSGPVDLREFLVGFLGEADEHLTSANANLAAVEQSLASRETNPRAVRELFRSLHTIKGLSAMVGVEPIVEISHAMETVLRTADLAGGRLSEGAADLLQKGLHAIDERVRALAKGAALPPAPESLIDAFAALDARGTSKGSDDEIALELDAALAAKFTASEKQQLAGAAAEGKRALRVDFTPSPGRADGLSITTVRERVGRVADIVKVVPVSIPESDASPGGLCFALFVATSVDNAILGDAAGSDPSGIVEVAHRSRAPEPALAEIDRDDGSDAHRGTFVRVEVSRLDEALECLSSLVVTRFKLVRAVASLAASGADVRDLSMIVGETGRDLRDLRAAIVRTRMVTVRSLLERVPLMVRGLTREADRAVKVILETGEAELDKSVAERVLPAIVHLVRNAVDHGIETRPERLRAGKPEAGTLRITCSQHSNTELDLTLSDDGRGLDRAAVAKRANRPVPANDAELLELITLPGVSTADRVTTTSGRGLGMDIVKRIVTGDLGGALSLETQPGVGTTFTLRVPLTITIVDAFSFECGGERFVTPIGSVEEIVEIDPAQVVHVPMARGDGRDAKVLRRRGEGLPLFGLSGLFGLKSESSGPGKALIVRRQTQQYAFEVERMLGQQEVVVRPLEDPLVRVTGVSGSTDLGDGKPTLVLDLVALCGTISSREEALV
jgi:two-component system chemotaxis sensor kinase CheA